MQLPLSVLRKILLCDYTPFVLVLLIALAVTVQNYSLGVNNFWGGHYTFFNNYVIFKYSFFHLIENRNLYVLRLGEHADLFKYSPTFALCMGILAYLPDFIGLFVWNALNCVVFLLGVRSLRSITLGRLYFMLAFCALELILTTQSSQSNALIAGLIMLAFSNMEKESFEKAAVLILAGTFIKLFAVVAALLFLFYPQKIKSALYLALFTALFFIAPLIVVSPSELLQHYQNWYAMLVNDHSQSVGTSVFTIFATLFGAVNKTTILGIGVVMLLLPLTQFRKYSEISYRTWYMAAILIWIVIFNHKGESPTYIVAMAGCAVWGAYTIRSYALTVILSVTWLLTSVIKTDLVPSTVKQSLNLDCITAFMPTIVLAVILSGLIFNLKQFKRTISV